MRLIEFEFEILAEGFKNVRGIGVITNDHAIQRAQERGIPSEVIDELIKKIFYVKNKFKPMDENQKFTIWSQSLNAGLGLRRRSDKEGFMRVEVMTAINRLYDNPDPVFTVG
jgi:hypothetical protein